MPFDEALRDAAAGLGIQQQFWDIFGNPHTTDAETNRAIVTGLGLDCASEETLRAGLIQRRAAEAAGSLPLTMVVSEADALTFPVNGEVITEAGARVSFTAGQALPKLPLGYHEIHAGGVVTRLIVAPDSAWPAPNGHRAGFGVTLYGLRSDRNWGCGDFRDLRDLIDWAAPALGVDFIALNPLHAIHNRRPYNTSPYLPNSIFYRNFLYLDVEAVAGYRPGEERAELAGLREAPTVEYERIAELKRGALEAIFAANPPGPECLEWIAKEGELLRVFATYCALDDFLHRANPNLWVWPEWPEHYRDPASAAVAQFAESHANEILFHGWLQWLIDQQIGEVQRHALAAGMGIGLYHDLALATDSCGSDLWAHRPFFITGCRVGSPPDDFSPSGQDWAFPPPNSERHRADGYRLFAASIRQSMRHGGALRIDHVMRLFRLYWIPAGNDAAHGAYVRDRAMDLVRVLALESVRNRCFIVGEDLGTVEPEVRETLERFGILSYRLFYFERRGGDFLAPAEYSPRALTSTTTHDLPTIAGFWTGQDILARAQAGVVDEAVKNQQFEARARDKQALLDALFRENLLPAGFERNANHIPLLSGDLHYAIMGYLAMTPSSLWLINQEDLTKEPYQQNLPGTTAEYPNWGRKMRWAIGDLAKTPEACDCAAMLRLWVERSDRLK